MRDEPFVVDAVEQRLILARWTSFRTPESAGAFRAAIVTAVNACVPSAVLCADWSGAGVVRPEVSDVLRVMLERANPRVERSAILLGSQGATFALQVERMVREAAHPARRTFFDSASLLAWLGPLLTPSQGARARHFLDEAPAPPHAP